MAITRQEVAIIWTDDLGFGGVAQYAHSMALGLKVRGFTVVFVQPKSYTFLQRERASQNIAHIFFPGDPNDTFGDSLSHVDFADSVLSQVRPSVVLFANCCPFSNLAGRERAARTKTPFIITEGFAEAYLPKLMPHLIERNRVNYDHANEIIGVSEYTLSILHSEFHLPKHLGKLIHYGRPPRFFVQADQSARVTKRLGLGFGDSTCVVTMVARLSAVKGHDLLLSALNILRENSVLDSIQVVIAGAGELESQLRRQILDNDLSSYVTLLSHIDKPDEILDASDIFVLPTRAEGMPLAIIEAMAKGLPVCASAVSGIPEQLGECGVLLPDPGKDPSATVVALATAIATLSKDEQVRRSMGQQLRARAQTLFVEARMVRETLQIIERACLPRGDYVAPGLEIVRPDSAFPFMVKGDPDSQPWPYLRRQASHNWYVDSRAPMVGFLSRDEAHILYNTAYSNSCYAALEIGAWLGWSASHIALGGVQLDVIDPLLERDEFRQSIEQSIEAAGVSDRITLYPGRSPELVHSLAASGKRWGLIFIDGDHDGAAPRIDAETCEQYAAADALILFHDLASPDVAAGLEYLRTRGWNVMIYHTHQIMGVAWRGLAVPIQHVPDPDLGLDLPSHLLSFPVSPSFIVASGQIDPEDATKPAAAMGTCYPTGTPYLRSLSRLAQESILEARSIIKSADPANPRHAAYVTQVVAEHLLGINNPATDDSAQLMRRIPGSHRLMTHLRDVFKSSGDVRNYLISDWIAQNGFLEPADAEAFREFDRIVSNIGDFTFLSRQRLWTLFCAVRQLCLDDVPGDIVECGTWRGGSAALLAATVKLYSLRPRNVWCCDTFEGMPAATEADTHRGLHANETPWGQGSLVAPRSEYFDVIAKKLAVQDIVIAVPGLFEHTLPILARQVSEIALLHADGDWYNSTMTIFTSLTSNIVSHGYIQIDDYGFWDGCRRAVHDYESKYGYRFNLHSIDDTGVWHRVAKETSKGVGDQLVEHAEACTLVGSEEEATSYARMALVFMPNSVRARRLLETFNPGTPHIIDTEVSRARALLADGNGTHAMRVLQTLLSTHPPRTLSTPFWLALIDASLVENKFQEALKIARELHQRDPNNDDVISRHATVHLALNEIPSAVAVLRPILEANQRMHNSRVLLAKLATILSDHNLVVSALEPLLASDAPETTFDPSLHQMYQQAQLHLYS